jgi:demethylmenaquinone methyltransferase/2-methoxy-6-polyprenyl-1,4-benzoquinol methylase
MPDDAHVLDVCTGTADVALAVARRYPKSHICGIDFANTMLRHAQTKITRCHRDKTLSILNADALFLPFSEHSFDLAFLSFGLRNLTDRRQGIQEIHRVLRPGGHLIMLEFAPPPKTLFGFLFRFYLGHIMPLIGGLISKSPAAYRYLHISIEQFPGPHAIMTLLQQTHFQHIHCQAMTAGMVYLYVGRKPAAT